jgi:hypothetical protein
MAAAYERFREAERLPATCEVVFGQAWAPAIAPPRPGSTDIHVSLADLKSQLAARRGA